MLMRPEIPPWHRRQFLEAAVGKAYAVKDGDVMHFRFNV